MHIGKSHEKGSLCGGAGANNRTRDKKGSFEISSARFEVTSDRVKEGPAGRGRAKRYTYSYVRVPLLLRIPSL